MVSLINAVKYASHGGMKNCKNCGIISVLQRKTGENLKMVIKRFLNIIMSGKENCVTLNFNIVKGDTGTSYRLN